MATLAMLNVLIGSDVSGLTKGLKTADKKTRSFSKRGGRAMTSFSNTTTNAVRRVVNLKSAVAVLAGSAGIGLLVANQLKSIDSTAKFADMIGESTKELVGLQHAAEITAGVTSNQFNMALQRMTRRVAEAANGTGEAKDAIKELGLSAQALNQMGPAAAFQKISAAMQDVDNQGERVRIAFKLFDSEGAKLVNTLNAGPEAIRELVSEADRLGRSFTRIDAAKVEAANDAITRAQGALSGVARTLTVELAPYIEAVANEFANASSDANGFRDVVISAVEGAAKAVGFLGDMFRGIRVVIKTLEVGFAMFAEGMYNSVLQIVDGLREMANVIPGIDIGPLEGLENIAKASTIRTNELKSELADLVEKPMPSDNIDAFFTRVKESAQSAAVEVAKSRKRMAAPMLGVREGTLGAQAGGTEGVLDRIKRAQNEVVSGNQEISDSMSDLQNAVEGWGKQSSKAFADFVTTGKASFSDLANSIINDMIQMMAYKSVFGPLSQGIMGMFSGGGAAMAGAQAGGAAMSFAGGGYTGSGPRSGGIDGQGGFPAILHPNETVIDHRGGNDGGVNINIINNVGAEVTTRETPDGNGGQNIEVMIDQAVARKMTEFGSSSNKALRQNFGASQRLASR